MNAKNNANEIRDWTNIWILSRWYSGDSSFIFICEPPTCRFLDSYSNFTAMKIKIKWNVKQIEINDFDPSEGLQNTKAKILALTGTKFAFRAVKVHHFSFQCRGTA